RANTAGSMQALTGLWQIFVRNGSISDAEADSTLAGALKGFGKLSSKVELYDATSSGIQTLLAATKAPEGLSLQDRVIDLLAGDSNPRDTESHQLVIQDLIRFFEAQKLVPLDHIFDLTNHLEALAAGSAQVDTALVNRIATRLEEIHLPREGLSSAERTSLSFGYWPERHISNQRKLKLRADVRAAAGRPNDLRAIRGDLAGILRDTLVGFNYLHYAPPGAQVLRTNPLFVRGHDFLGTAGTNHTWETAEVFGTGWPSSAGGRLVGSLGGLPYALAEAEQNFMIPEKEQALIWSDLAPQMILNAKIPRWWNVTASQMHWLALHQRYGESAIAEAAILPDYRKRVLEQLARQATPARVKKVEDNLNAGDITTALEFVTPSELFVLASALLEEHPVDDVLAAEIRRLEAADPERVNHQAISRAFGSPKPTLATSYRPELLHMRTFPTLMGYSSRIMAESWESNLLYFATLADELHLRPSQLNIYVPEWTQKTVEAIFATHLEDWPAVLRSLRSVGDDVRADFRQRLPGTAQASLR
ncbi:MAG: hypothetical protein GY953_50880, partial [bacterium]|nr:hypothetical protein [bacterium]